MTTKQIIFIRHAESTANLANDNNKFYDPNNIILTNLGNKQAQITGKYLAKTYGKFDVIYSSPAIRCKQTAEIIKSNINLKNDNIIIDELLMEEGTIFSNVDGLSKDERNKFYNKNKKIIDLEKKVLNTENKFIKYNLMIKLQSLTDKYMNYKPSLLDIYNNYSNFLNKIKKSPYKKILVVAHSGTLSYITKIICNINIFTPLLYIKEAKPYENNIDIKIHNCSIACFLFSDNNFSLISPANNQHLL